MSNFFSNLFGGSKTKTKKEKPKEPSIGSPSQPEENDEDQSELPALNRRLSLSKSGRMKEKKRTNMSVMKNNLDGRGPSVEANHQKIDDRKGSFPSTDVFDVEGIEKAAGK